MGSINTDISLKGKSYNYGLDLLRILSMLSIIGLHVVNAGGAYTNSNNPFVIYVWQLFYLLIVSSVNVFAMLSGYLYAGKKNVRHKNIVNLIVTALFYYIVITVSFCFFYQGKLTLMEIFAGLFPPAFDYNWYIVSYTFLFFCIPFINLFISKVSKQIFQKLIILIFVLLSVIPTFGLADYFKTGSGYSPWWLMFCYMVGAYIKLYGIHIKHKIRFYIIVGAACAAVCALVLAVGLIVLGDTRSFGLIKQYTSPNTVILAISILLIFKDIKVSMAVQRPIKYISSLAFAVYISHCNPLIMKKFFADRFAFLDDWNFMLSILMVVLICIAIYAVCSLAEMLRRVLFRLFKADRLIDFIGQKLDGILSLNEK